MSPIYRLIFCHAMRSMWHAFHVACVPCGMGSMVLLVDMRKHVIQASYFMLHLVHASLYTKETKQVDENVNENLPDQNDINSGEEGLAICIEGYVRKSEIVGAKITPDMLEDENEKEEFVVDGEVDEGYFHIKPVYKKSIPM
ncbi:hypothetical protein Tco_1546222, partial [Tanacetum coccineum]